MYFSPVIDSSIERPMFVCKKKLMHSQYCSGRIIKIEMRNIDCCNENRAGGNIFTSKIHTRRLGNNSSHGEENLSLPNIWLI